MYAVQGVFVTMEIFPTATLPRVPECCRYSSQSIDFRGVGKDTKTAKLGMYLLYVAPGSQSSQFHLLLCTLLDSAV